MSTNSEISKSTDNINNLKAHIGECVCSKEIKLSYKTKTWLHQGHKLRQWFYLTDAEIIQSSCTITLGQENQTMLVKHDRNRQVNKVMPTPKTQDLNSNLLQYFKQFQCGFFRVWLVRGRYHDELLFHQRQDYLI